MHTTCHASGMRDHACTAQDAHCNCNYTADRGCCHICAKQNPVHMQMMLIQGIMTNIYIGIEVNDIKDLYRK